MLSRSVRQAAVLSTSRRLLSATSKQKRALNPDQISGHKESSPLPPSSSPPAATTTTSSSSNLVPIGIGVAALAAGGVYFFRSSSGEETKKKEPTVVEKAVVKKDALAETTTKDDSSSSKTGNRVTVIDVPAKMKNSSSVIPAIAVHPIGGHRVSVMPPPTTSKETTTMTEKAIAQLKETTKEEATEALLASHQSILSEAYVADLDKLSNAQLKARIVQLATEMKDRTKWEAVRLKEFLAMKEKETADTYLELMQKQRLEFEDLLAKRLREKEGIMATELRNAIQEKEDNVQTLLTTALEAQKNEFEADKKAFEELKTQEIRSELEEQFGTKLEQYKRKTASDLQEKVAMLDKLTEKLKHLESAVSATKSTQQGSLKAHRLSAAALALAEKLETNQSAATELLAMKAAAGPDGVIPTALLTIPESVKDGVPTLSELQTRFETVYKKSRQAALVPAGRAGLEGQLAGMLFATLKYAPDPDDPAPESDKDNAEYVLVRARHHVKLGELEQAVDQLEKLEGQTAFTVADWKKDAINRVTVDKALKVIKLECALVNKSLVD